MAAPARARGRVLVTGASGNVGREVVRALERAGFALRLPARAGEPTSGGASIERAPFDFYDRATFRPVLHGCEGLFLLRPPAISDVGPTLNALVDEARACGVRHVVFLSVVGAGANPFVPHHAVEAHLRRGPGTFTLLRPGFFAQNLGDAYRRDIVEAGRLSLPAGRGAVAFVDVRDVAEVAALAFADPSAHASRAYTLTGPEALRFDEVARTLTEELARTVRYEPASALGYARALAARGLPATQIAVQTVLHLNIRLGRAAKIDPTLERLLGRRARTLRDYVRDHAALLRPPAAGPDARSA
ncbi:MAG TPA: NmrA family NAD(P)-binding protein [Polyangiaceae bacterium]|nr:NmrA family NAD(P)-binding protein [Polyangiaceae bacterium]